MPPSPSPRCQAADLDRCTAPPLPLWCRQELSKHPQLVQVLSCGVARSYQPSPDDAPSRFTSGCSELGHSGDSAWQRAAHAPRCQLHLWAASEVRSGCNNGDAGIVVW